MPEFENREKINTKRYLKHFLSYLLGGQTLGFKFLIMQLRFFQNFITIT